LTGDKGPKAKKKKRESKKRAVPSKMGASIELTIETHDVLVAKALNEALMPDNRYFPKDQSFHASTDGRTIRFDIGSPRVRPALSTAASIISDAKLFADVWVECKTKGLARPAPP
jgi:hypothetical protein